MRGKSCGPEPPGRIAKRRPREAGSAISQKSPSLNAATDSRDAQQPQQKTFSPPDTQLAVLRAENALLVRVRRQMRRILDELGGRTLLELAIECADRRGDLATLDEITGFYLARGRRHLLRATGGDQFVTEWSIDIAPGSRRR
jgi:hypothetical protein